MRRFRDLHRHLGRDKRIAREATIHVPTANAPAFVESAPTVKREGGQAHQQAHDDGIKHQDNI